MDGGEKLVRAALPHLEALYVVFIDEIDSLFVARISSCEIAGALVCWGVITEVTSEMDSLCSSPQDRRAMVTGTMNKSFGLGYTEEDTWELTH